MWSTVGVIAGLLAVFSMLLFADDSTNAVDWKTWVMERIDDDIIRELVRNGEVCRVVGHIWQEMPHVTLEYRPDGDYPRHRKCALCGKEETKEPGTWK